MWSVLSGESNSGCSWLLEVIGATRLPAVMSVVGRRLSEHGGQPRTSTDVLSTLCQVFDICLPVSQCVCSLTSLLFCACSYGNDANMFE